MRSNHQVPIQRGFSCNQYLTPLKHSHVIKIIKNNIQTIEWTLVENSKNFNSKHILIHRSIQFSKKTMRNKNFD